MPEHFPTAIRIDDGFHQGDFRRLGAESLGFGGRRPKRPADLFNGVVRGVGIQAEVGMLCHKDRGIGCRVGCIKVTLTRL